MQRMSRQVGKSHQTMIAKPEFKFKQTLISFGPVKISSTLMEFVQLRCVHQSNPERGLTPPIGRVEFTNIWSRIQIQVEKENCPAANSMTISCLIAFFVLAVGSLQSLLLTHYLSCQRWSLLWMDPVLFALHFSANRPMGRCRDIMNMRPLVLSRQRVYTTIVP